MFTMESWLNNAALPQPRSTLIGKQAIAKNPAGVAHHVVFHEVLILGHQHRLDVFGVIQKVNVDPACAVIKDIAKFVCPLLKRRQRIFMAQGEIANGKMRLGAGRAVGGRWSHHNRVTVPLILKASHSVNTLSRQRKIFAQAYSWQDYSNWKLTMTAARMFTWPGATVDSSFVLTFPKYPKVEFVIA